MSPIFGGTMMKKLKLLITLVPAMAVSLLIGSSFALAQDIEISDPASEPIDDIVAMGEAVRSEEKSVKVAFADLNLKNEQGALALYQRLQRASETVCDVNDARKTKRLKTLRDAHHCYHRALSSAVESVGSEMLLSIHHDREPGEMFAATVK